MLILNNWGCKTKIKIKLLIIWKWKYQTLRLIFVSFIRQYKTSLIFNLDNRYSEIQYMLITQKHILSKKIIKIFNKSVKKVLVYEIII